MTPLRALVFLGIAVIIIGSVVLYQQGGFSLDVGRFFAFEGDTEAPQPSNEDVPPPSDACEVAPTNENCADGDCDGDGDPNAAGPAAFANQACNDPNDDNRCTRAQLNGDQCTGSSEETLAQNEPAPAPPTSDACEVAPTNENCADGDCDGDGDPNAAGPAAFANQACNDPNDDNRCTRAQTSGSECTGNTEAIPAPAPETATAPDTCSVESTNEGCADGDCDGDTDPNAQGPTAFANQACNDPNDNNRCTRAQKSGSECTGNTEAIPAPAPEAASAPDACEVAPTNENCADGDCDGDGDPNAAGPAAFANQACNDPNDDNRCTRAQTSGSECTGASEAILTPTPATPVPTPTRTPTPTPTPPGQSTCVVAGGSACSQQSTCPAGFTSLGPTTDCTVCCRSTSSPTPTPSSCSVEPTNEGCADGDCDGDGALNPAAPNANPVKGCNDQNDGDHCVGSFLAPAQCGSQPSATPPLPVANHLECRSNTCVVVSGAGANSCGPENSTCGNVSAASGLADQIRSSFGVRVEGSYSEGELQAIINGLSRFEHGNLNTIKSSNCSGGCAGTQACMCDNGVMTLRPGGAISSQVLGHELFHAVQFSNGGVMSRSRSLFSSAGGNYAVPDFIVPFVGGLGGGELMAYVVQTNVAQPETNRARAQDFLSRGITGPRDQYNFATEFRGAGGDPIAQVQRHYGFASLGKIFAIQSAYAAEETIVLDDHHTAEVPGPSLQILSPGDGAPVTVATVQVSGKAFANATSNSPIARVGMTFNGAVVADAVLSPAVCGTQACVQWTTMLTLRPGANAVQVSAVDQAGVTSQETPAVVINYVAAIQAVAPGALGGVAGVPTGPGRATTVALLVAACASLLYAGYTRSGTFRRREAEAFAKEGAIKGRNIDFLR